MVLEGINEGQVAECLGISTVTLWRKYRRGGDFRREEIEKLIEYLHIEDPVPVFFAS